MQDLATTVLEYVETAAIAVDESGVVAVYNPAAARIVGVAVDRVLGHALADLEGQPDPLASLVEVLEQARHSGRGCRRRQLTVDAGTGRRSIGYGISMLSAGGSAALFFADITEALAAERAVAEERRFAEVGHIASAMVHELKAPLATVELYVTLARRAMGEDAPAAEHLQVIRDQTRACLDRLRTMLHSIAPDGWAAGGIMLTEVEPVAREVVTEQHRRHPDAQIHLRAQAAGQRVALPESDLVSVLSNLITNAVEVTNGKGPVDVSVTAREEDIVLRVADRGPGLPDGDLFAPFFSTKSGGSGLGLWLVRRLASRAGGEVIAGDRRDGGASFRVELPLPRTDRLAGAEILLVEDDKAVARAQRAALTACGARVAVYSRGEDVPLTGRTWQCAVLDFHLPGQSGIDTAMNLADETPVLIVSGDSLAAGSVARLGAKRAWFLAKPFEMDVLVDLVSLLVRGT